MPDASTVDRPLPGRQREARSNDTAILAAAREVFAAHGHGASMADVARQAGVGVGSVYRRYPTKEALVEALHVHAVREAAGLAVDIADEAERPASTAGDDDGAVARFLARQITGATGPLLRPRGVQGPLPPELSAASDELRAGIERLIAHDRAADLVPAGLVPADVMQLLLRVRPALPLPREQADALHLRYLAVLVRGLREQARAGIALDDGPSWDEWVGVWHE